MVAASSVAAPSTRAASAWAAPEAPTGGLQAPSPPWLARRGVARVEVAPMLGVSSVVSAAPTSWRAAKDVREDRVSSVSAPAGGSSVARP